jgi:3-methylfumaryl-CoA hydratase
MSDSNTIDIDFLKTWIGKERLRQDDLSPFKAQALAAALDREDSLQTGDELPPSWQWLYFVDTPQASATGVDGHPKTGGFLPPAPLPRRMWAAGNYTIHKPLVLGRVAEQHSVIKSVDLKTGKSGTLLFVTVEHNTRQDGELCLREEQNIVYRDMPTAPAPLPAGETAPQDADWRMEITPDPVLLFRYSALTYNGHRIHYDRDYAVNTEFYPALVVHGPLLATLLAELVAKNIPEARMETFAFRAQRPSFDTDKFTVCGKRDGDTLSLWTCSHDGFIGMTAKVKLRSE